MIRQVLKLAWAALVVEAKRWADPEPAGVVEPEPEPPKYTYTQCIMCCADLGGTFEPKQSVCDKCLAKRHAPRRPRRPRMARKPVPSPTKGEP